ncbi:MAG: PqqD family protein [Sphingomonadaceae bacterium]|nr:PqqD family protein [Sphingomonadaceae bacterium]
MIAITKIPDQFIETDVDDEVVIVGLTSGEFFSLRDTGLAVWKLIDGTRSQADIILELSNNFSGEQAEIKADVDAFLNQLRAASFIH